MDAELDYQGFINALDDKGCSALRAAINLHMQSGRFNRQGVMELSGLSYSVWGKREKIFLQYSMLVGERDGQSRPGAGTPYTYSFPPNVDVSLLSRMAEEGLRKQTNFKKNSSPKKNAKPFSIKVDKFSKKLSYEESFELLKTAFMQLKPDVRLAHTELFVQVASYGVRGVEALSLSAARNEKTSTTNSRLGRLGESQAVLRIKEDGPYRYFVNPRIDIKAVHDVMKLFGTSISALDQDLSSANFTQEQKVQIQEAAVPSFAQPNMNSIENNESHATDPKSPEPDLRERIAKILPPFDESWPDDWKASWFAAVQKMAGEK